MAVPDQTITPVRQPEILHSCEEDLGFEFDGLRKKPSGANPQDIRQRIVDIVGLTEPDNAGKHVHGVSLSSRGSGRLDTRLDTPPSHRRRHPVSLIAPAHKHPKVIAWLGHHPRFTFHFTPTSCSWLNAVETFFATLTKRRLKRGVFRSVVDLQAAINRYLDEANHDPKPFTWTANPDKIIAAVNRGRQALESIH